MPRPMRRARLRVVPTTLSEANALVARWHRHHAPAVGNRFSVGVACGEALVGAAIVGNPVARLIATGDVRVIEVTRWRQLCVPCRIAWNHARDATPTLTLDAWLRGDELTHHEKEFYEHP